MQGRIINKFTLTLFSILLTSCGGGGGGLPTTPAEDKTPPSIIETIPSSEQAGVLPTDSIKITFSESLKSINSYFTKEQVVVYLINDVTGSRVEPAIQLDETLFSLETKNTENDVLIVPFTNTGDLKVSSQYQVTVKGVKDLADNNMLENCTWDFTTGENGLVTKKITLGNTGLCGTQPNINAPNQVESVQAFSIDDSTVLVSWTPPITGSKVDYYQVERSVEQVIGEPATVSLLKPFETNLSFLDTTAKPGKKHTYKITAGNILAGFSTLATLSNMTIPQNGQQTIPPTQMLLPNNPLETNIFGSDFKISPDGKTLAVADISASTGTNPIFTNAGVVHVFTKIIDSWRYTTTITSSTPDNNAYFGKQLTFSHDSETLAIHELNTNISNSTVELREGSVQLFTKVQNDWRYTSRLISNTPQPSSGNEFGYAITFSPDNKTIVVGAPWNGDTGDIQLFTKTSTGAWQHQITLYSSTAIFISRFTPSFGHKFEFNSTGTTLAIADPFSTVTGTYNGSVQLFKVAADGSGWQYSTTLTSINPTNNNRFGGNLIFSPDGSTLAIAEPRADLSSTTVSAVHFYGETADGWIYINTLYPKEPRINNQTYFTFSFSPDSKTLAMSTFIDRVTGIGSLQLFTKKSNSWRYSSQLVSNLPTSANAFGINFRFSPNNAILAVTASNANIDNSTTDIELLYKTEKGWQYATTLVSNTPATNNNFGFALEFSSDSKTLIVGETGAFNIFDLTKLVK